MAVSSAESDTTARTLSRATWARERGARPHVGEVARGVKRADHGTVPTDERAEGRAGHRGFVQVHEIGLDAAEHLGGTPHGRGTGRDGRDRPVRVPLHAGPDRHDAGLGRRPVARPDDPHVDAQLAQLAREAEHLALHAARTRERVRRHHHDAHVVTSPCRLVRTDMASASVCRLGVVPMDVVTASCSRPGRSASSAGAGATAPAPPGSAARARWRASA